MERIIEQWSAEELYNKRHLIQYPDYQREPTVWSENKRRLLIDSMLRGLDIPKIYLYKYPDSEEFDCVDGQQRIVSVIAFFDGGLSLLDGRTWDDLNLNEQDTIINYRFTIGKITEATDDELRLLFLRLQLGSPLNTGELLHAMKGDIRDFVFKWGKDHPFFQNVRIPRKRFARETVFAQICINSFYRSFQDSFYPARYENLKPFFEQYYNLTKFSKNTDRIKLILDKLDEYFGENAKILRNRASIVSAYLFLEELVINKKDDEIPIFVDFYIEFLGELRIQAKKGLDYDREYRELLDFQTYVIQASVAKASIERRQKILIKYFDYYLENEIIMRSEPY